MKSESQVVVDVRSISQSPRRLRAKYTHRTNFVYALRISPLQGASRRQADIQEFQQTFPEAAKDPNSIPPQVWADVRNGSSLVAAYARYAVQQARQDAAAAKRETTSVLQNQRNAERSTGSMQSAGDGLKSKDPFLEGWGD